MAPEPFKTLAKLIPGRHVAAGSRTNRSNTRPLRPATAVLDRLSPPPKTDIAPNFPETGDRLLTTLCYDLGSSGNVMRLSSKFRTEAGKTLHATGMVLAATQLAWGIHFAFDWGMPYGGFVLISAFCYATGIYLVGRIGSRIVNRRARDRSRLPAGASI